VRSTHQTTPIAIHYNSIVHRTLARIREGGRRAKTFSSRIERNDGLVKVQTTITTFPLTWLTNWLWWWLENYRGYPVTGILEWPRQRRPPWLSYMLASGRSVNHAMIFSAGGRSSRKTVVRWQCYLPIFHTSTFDSYRLF